MLYLVPTPIGNLEDMTLRGLRILKEVDLILAEDTRVSGKLLKHFEIGTPMKSFHAHNEHKVLDEVCDLLESGQNLALISDAGTPGISDPGFLLVRACKERAIEVTCLPGANAIIPALVGSGLPSDKFVFEGFLPHKKGRQTRLNILKDDPRTVIFYESPHRLLKTLKQLLEMWGDRKACVSRELSKIHEEHKTDLLSELVTHFESKAPKGEIVLCVDGKKD